MSDRPLLVLPTPARVRPGGSPRGGGNNEYPTRDRQVERLEPSFKSLKAIFAKRQAELQISAAGHVPEEVVVFETVGAIADFLKAAKRIPGFEYLAEWDVDHIDPDGDFHDSKDASKSLTGRVFLAMSNQRALAQMLRLWGMYSRGDGAPRGFAPFYRLFGQLYDLRTWSVEDRLLDTGVVDQWNEIAGYNSVEPIPFEVELWYRETVSQRTESVDRVRQIITGMGGQITSVAEIEPIRYHSLMVNLPESQVRTLVANHGSSLLGENSVMFFRPSGQTSVPLEDLSEVQPGPESTSRPLPAGEPTVALLDGLPLENHSQLTDRLVVDDPDDFAADYLARERNHGTAMASIIVHGDLNAPGRPLPRPLYVRPLLRPDRRSWDGSSTERIPFYKNSLDLTYRCVRRMFEGDGDTPATAPHVKVVNFSIGDALQPFHASVSAWGRLLDWLSVKYNVLFCVSAGNYTGSITLNVPRAELRNLLPEDRERELFRALYLNLRLRRILAPADAINAVTVGAAHEDAGPAGNIPDRIDLITSETMPSPVSALGCGLKGSTKPDVLFPGGRQVYSEKPGNTHEFATLDLASAIVPPGISVAAPSQSPGDSTATKYCRGTSNATAWASRSAGFFYEQLTSLRDEPGGERLSDDYAPVLLKAMLVHGARWGTAADKLEAYLGGNGMKKDKFRRLASRFLGYGLVSPTESIECDEHRATMIGCGELSPGAAHDYRIPLPPSLSGIRGHRRLVITLAWLSPISAAHRDYRTIALWFDAENGKMAIARDNSEWQTARKGTIQHEVFEGEKAAAYAQDEQIRIRVNCRQDATTVAEPIRYGLLVSLEVAAELKVAVYDEIAARIRPVVTIGARTS